MMTFFFVFYIFATYVIAWDFYSCIECKSTATQRILVGAARIRARKAGEVSE